jgi:hypothetical protein
MHLPGDLWVADVSTSFPDATFRLLTGVPVGDRSLELGEVLAADPRPPTQAVCDHRDTLAADVLHAGDDRALLKYETSEQGLFEFLGATSLPPEFPLTVEDGVMEFTVTATRAEFDALGETLDDSGLRYDLLSVVHGGSRSDLLTDRQRECLGVALRMGYFEVPRETTLAAGAMELGVDTSTASETIRRGTGRVLDWFFVAPE